MIVMPAIMQPGKMPEVLFMEEGAWNRTPSLGVEKDWEESLKRRSRRSGTAIHGGGRGMTEREWDRWCSTVSSLPLQIDDS